jgi:hypothetical protein
MQRIEDMTTTEREMRLLEYAGLAAGELERIRLLLEYQFGVEVRYNEFGDPYVEVNEGSA